MTNLETNLLEVLTREAVGFCSRTVRLFPTPLAQMRTALIRDFHQWFCKESARRAVRRILKFSGAEGGGGGGGGGLVPYISYIGLCRRMGYGLISEVLSPEIGYPSWYCDPWLGFL